MKFYFCQGCGRRITDREIAAGEGRDKKLKGVYCTECAIGVTTMESLPVSNDDARKILTEEKKAEARTRGKDQGPSPARAGRRRTSGAAILSARTASGRDERSSDRIASPGPSASKPPFLMMVGIGIACSAFLFAGVVFFSDQKAPQPKRSVEAPTSKTGSVNKDRGSPITNGLPPVRATGKHEPPDTTDSRPRADTTARQARQDSEQTKNHLPELGRADDNASSEPGVLKEPTEKEGTRKTASGDDTKQAPLETRTAKPLKPEPSPTEARLASRLRTWLRAYEAHDTEAMKTEADGMAGDPLLKEQSEAVNALKAAATVLARWQAQRLNALEKLKDRTLNLQTSKGPRKGRVVKASEEVLELLHEYRINNRVAGGVTHKVKVSELSAKDRARILPKVEPKTPDEWAARALLGLAERDLQALDESLAHCKGHPLAAAIGGERSRLEGEIRERDAERAFEGLMGRLEGAKDRKKAARLMDDLATFEDRFAGTAVLKDKAKGIETARASLKTRALRSRNW